MDVDRFVRAHEGDWQRLDHLLRRARRLTRLDAAELDDLVRLHQRVSTHLSLARTRVRDRDLVLRLTDLVARSGAVVYGTPARTTAGLANAVLRTFPEAVWRIRAFVGIAAALFVVPAVGLGLWISTSDAALDATAPEAVRAAYVNEDFEAYYSSAPAEEFASSVFTNNARVGALAFAAGLAFAVPAAVLVAWNGANLGVAAGLFGAAGRLGAFFGLILPHGLLELTAVFVAGGAGLRLGWTLIDPGDRRRGVALTDEARRTIPVIVGLVGVFLVAGIIEGFVTGSSMPTVARVGTGVVAEVAFLAYVVLFGRGAAPASVRGDRRP